MKPRVLAVILSYWEERIDNVSISKRALFSGSVAPDDLIVLNNNPNYRFPSLGSTKIVDSSWNSWTRGKYGVALMQPADYYLLLDDDITVGPRTLEYLLKHADTRSCVAGRGIILDEDGSFWHGQSVSPEEIQKETVVDSIVGRLQFVSFASILNMFEVEQYVRLDDQKYLYEAEDILMGLCNRSTILPMRGDECPVDISEQGVSLCQFVKDYSQMRDDFTKKVLRACLEMGFGHYDAPWYVRDTERVNKGMMNITGSEVEP